MVYFIAKKVTRNYFYYSLASGGCTIPPTFWVDRLGEEHAMATAVNLQRDAGIMLSNLQILSQFVTSLHRISWSRINHTLFKRQLCCICWLIRNPKFVTQGIHDVLFDDINDKPRVTTRTRCSRPNCYFSLE